MRILAGAAILAIASLLPSGATAETPPRNHYGSEQGVPPVGYKDELTTDGYWKVEGSSRRNDDSLAIDIAIYRAAEMARAAGFSFVEVHDVYASQTRLGDKRATLFARGTTAPANPGRCRSGKARRCYTAEVAAVFRQLSGATGREPGVPAPTTDEYGRTVLKSGFGVGAVDG